MSGVFISYVHENSGTVDQLKKVLELNGVEVWLDRERLLPGVRWRQAIAEAIRSGTYFLSVHSKERENRDKTYSNEELAVAVEEIRLRPANKTWLIPIRLDETPIEPRPIGFGETLLDLQICDLRDWEAGVTSLLEALGVENPILNEKKRNKHKKGFVAPQGSPHTAVFVLQSVIDEYGVDWFDAEALEDAPSNTVTDLVGLGLLERSDKKLRLISIPQDSFLAVAVAFSNTIAAQATLQVLEQDLASSGTAIGTIVSDALNRGWSEASKVRNGQALRKWIFVFYPNLRLPTDGEPNFLKIKSAQRVWDKAGRRALITSELYPKISEMKKRRLTLSEMGKELGIHPETVRRFRRADLNRWDRL